MEAARAPAQDDPTTKAGKSMCNREVGQDQAQDQGQGLGKAHRKGPGQTQQGNLDEEASTRKITPE